MLSLNSKKATIVAIIALVAGSASLITAIFLIFTWPSPNNSQPTTAVTPTESRQSQGDKDTKNTKLDTIITWAKTEQEEYQKAKESIWKIKEDLNARCSLFVEIYECARKLQEIAEDQKLVEAFKKTKQAGITVLINDGSEIKISLITGSSYLFIPFQSTNQEIKKFLGLE